MSSVVDGLLNPVDSASIGVERELARVADRLRIVTVQVRNGSGGGSGVIWRSDGLIVTNAHVAARGGQLVVLDDGRKFRAKPVARDPRHDLAALGIDATGLVAAQVRDPAMLRIGELVLAIGNPMGNVGAVSQGIVHARSVSGWIQADIRLAPGNSGGPLADAQGRVVGINSMVVNGLALAVSSTAVERFLASERRPRLGVTVQSNRSGAFGTATVDGLLLVELEPNGPAHLAGLMVGDILLAAGGKPLQSVDTLAEAIAAALPSGVLGLDFVRSGRLINCHVKIGNQKDEAA